MSSVALLFVTLGQLVISCNNYLESSPLVGYTRDTTKASNRSADAAEGFSTSASRINEGIGKAVTQLETQARAIETSRKSSETASGEALHATIENFHLEQRAWLTPQVASGELKSGRPIIIKIPIINSGKTPARNVVVYFSGKTERTGQKVTYNFDGQTRGIGNVAPGFTIFFNYPGTSKDSGQVIAPPLAGYTLFVFGAITYEDVFGHPHWITYCFFGTEEDSYAYCQEHNDAGDGTLPRDTLQPR